jgi:hypothetical protein
MIDQNQPEQAWMRFKTAVIPYSGDDSWVEAKILRAKEIVIKRACPSHRQGCEFNRFLVGVDEAMR